MVGKSRANQLWAIGHEDPGPCFPPLFYRFADPLVEDSTEVWNPRGCYHGVREVRAAFVCILFGDRGHMGLGAMGQDERGGWRHDRRGAAVDPVNPPTDTSQAEGA